MRAYVGTSGWVYRSWRGRFYPADLHQGRWLEFYSRSFATVEVNATFYRLPAATMVRGWARRTPADFRFAVKVSRLITHVRRLREIREPLETFLETMEPLGAKLGPLLVQLPPGLTADERLLDEALAAFPREHPVAVEFRHESWFAPAIREVLERHQAALCIADRDEELVAPLWRTAPWSYVRFHVGQGEPAPGYRPETLERRAEQLLKLCEEGDELYAYFNNDPFACAVRDAARFAAALAARGVPVSRTPTVDDVHAPQ